MMNLRDKYTKSPSSDREVPTKTLTDLPNELKLEVMKMVSWNDLKHLGVVSKEIRAVAINLLFERTVVRRSSLRGHAEKKGIAHFLAGSAWKQYATMIKHLTIVDPDPTSRSDSGFAEKVLDSLPLNKLKTLHLDLSRPQSFNFISKIRSQHGAQLSELSIAVDVDSVPKNVLHDPFPKLDRLNVFIHDQLEIPKILLGSTCISSLVVGASNRLRPRNLLRSLCNLSMHNLKELTIIDIQMEVNESSVSAIRTLLERLTKLVIRDITSSAEPSFLAIAVDAATIISTQPIQVTDLEIRAPFGSGALAAAAATFISSFRGIRHLCIHLHNVSAVLSATMLHSKTLESLTLRGEFLAQEDVQSLCSTCFRLEELGVDIRELCLRPKHQSVSFRNLFPRLFMIASEKLLIDENDDIDKSPKDEVVSSLHTETVLNTHTRLFVSSFAQLPELRTLTIYAGLIILHDGKGFVAPNNCIDATAYHIYQHFHNEAKQQGSPSHFFNLSLEQRGKKTHAFEFVEHVDMCGNKTANCVRC